MTGLLRLARLLAVALTIIALPARADDGSGTRKVITDALAEAVSIPQQAQTLVDLTWPSTGPGDPRVAAMARQELIGFGAYGLEALREAIFTAAPEFQADVVATLVDARRAARTGSPHAYLPALEEAIWYGSIEARRLAMAEISMFVFPPAVLSTIDAIYEEPELALHGIRALGRMRDERSRFFLGRVLNHSEPRYKEAAAASLVLLNETGLQVLRNAVRSESRDVRLAAIHALLPYTAVDDLTRLYEYVDLHGDTDGPEVLERIRERARELEILLEEQQLAEAASAETETEP